MPLTVRRARRADLASLARLCRSHARFERGRVARGFASRLDKALFRGRAKAFAWVAMNEAVLIGYATASAAFSTWQGMDYLHLDCLYLVEGARNRGGGAMLMSAVLAHARSQGYRQIQWQTPVWNTRAQHFYSRLGASQHVKVRFHLIVPDRGTPRLTLHRHTGYLAYAKRGPARSAAA